MTTPDLTRIGTPEVAAAAAKCGLTSSVVLPIQSGDQRVGALQLLGSVGLPVTGEQGDAVRVVAATLAARLVDAYALRRTGPPRLAVMPVPRPAAPQPLPAPRPASTSQQAQLSKPQLPKPHSQQSQAQKSQPQKSQPGRSQPQHSQPLAVLPPQREASERKRPTSALAADEVTTAAITAVPAELPVPRRPLRRSRHAKPVDAPEPTSDTESRRSGRRRAANVDGSTPSAGPPQRIPRSIIECSRAGNVQPNAGSCEDRPTCGAAQALAGFDSSRLSTGPNASN